MCIGGSSPPPAPPPPAPIAPPPPPQDAKAPDIQASYAIRKKGASTASVGDGKMTGGTLLTGPAGIDNSKLSTGKTLLGQ